jgi:hypothetical protein
MGAKLSTPQEATKATSKAGQSFRVLYKMDSKDAAVRLGNTRMIVGFDDFMIANMLEKLKSSTKLGVKLLGELRRFELENVVTIRILNKRRLADRHDLHRLVEKVEETCAAIRDFLCSLQVCVITPKAGDDWHEQASKLLQVIGETRDDLLWFRLSLFPAGTEVEPKAERPRGCMQLLLTAIAGCTRQGLAI